ncbi:MAG: glycosyltransferase family 2 protein [Deltaproteobacteria bacterium]|jgi:glycosyltransferase involved in cell wall biosynthesis|nr:glycosyltransferase family 2 protein [Deltaproteobacteria bacterium]
MNQSKTEIPDPQDPQLSIVIPVYNERETIHDIIAAVEATSHRKEIIVVDDGSTDGTRDILKSMKQENLKVIMHDRNQGKGAALQTGFSHAAGDIIIIQDADLEYDPAEYPVLLKPILAGKADVVYGSRFAGHGAHRVLYFWHYAGNRFLTLLSNIFTNLNLTDMETCYKVFTKEALAGVQIREKRFGFEPEITAKMARKKLRIYEVPISYYGRTYEEGKKINWKDGVRALWCILKYNLWG